MDAALAPAAEAPALDRRHRRRQETIEEVLDIAVEIMAEQGVAGLSIGEIARRMGMRPPSLYVYFPSKHALYDALFARGAQLVLDAMAGLAETPAEGRSLEDVLLEDARAFVRWTVEHPAYAQLLYWRPVPRFNPSPEAFAPAQRMVERGKAQFAELQRRGLLRGDVPVDDIFGAWICVTSGVVTRQLANAPGESFDEGRYTGALPDLVAMFAAHYGRQGGPARADQR
jgi:AcrR family transcriptional regulator